MPTHHQELTKSAIQVLFVSARAWDLTALLRELKSRNTEWKDVGLEEFVLALVEFSKKLPTVGLKITIEGGRVDLHTLAVKSTELNSWMHELNPTPSNRISESMLEALAIVAIKQPVTASEVERLCNTDRRDALQRLEVMGMIERRAGQERGYSYITTPQFLNKFGENAVQTLRDSVHASVKT